jgi:hypothetical protein
MAARRGAWSRFAADVAWSAQACLAAPLVTFLWLAGSLLPLLNHRGALSLLLLPLGLFFLGFHGTVRLSFALHRVARPGLSPDEIWAATWRYLGRFLCLSLGAGVILGPFAGLALGLSHHHRLTYLLAIAPLLVVVDAVATFVPPALALSTHRVTEALATGWGVLRNGLRDHRWHVFAPPLALQIVAAGNFRNLPPGAQAAVLLPAGILGLLVRGAITAAYLRAMPVSISGPSWLDGRPRQVAPTSGP